MVCKLFVLDRNSRYHNMWGKNPPKKQKHKNENMNNDHNSFISWHKITLDEFTCC